MNRKSLMCVALLTILAHSALAADTQQSNTALTNTSMANTYQEINHNQQDHAIASSWGLTTQEYQRYQYIVNNTSDGYSWADKHLDPNFILAAEATNQQDFKKYVTQLAINEHNRLERALKVSVAMAAVAKQLYPNQMPIMLGQSKYITNTLKPGDAIKAFIDIKNSQSVTLIARILQKVESAPGARADLFFVGNPSVSEIEAFAVKDGISKDLVNSQIVTLNYGDEQYKQFINGDLQQIKAAGIKVAIPLVVVMRKGQYLYASF